MYIYISKWSIISTKVKTFLDIQHDFIRRSGLPVTYRYTVAQNFKPNELETE